MDYRTCGPMDKAPAYGEGDSRFDPWHVHTNNGKCKLKESIRIVNGFHRIE